MNVRTKTFFIILAVGIIVSLAMSLFLGDLIRKSTLREEAQITKDKVEQFNAQINAQQQELTSLTKDWAEWDDSYRYLLDRNPEFIQSNFVSGTISITILISLRFTISRAVWFTVNISPKCPAIPRMSFTLNRPKRHRNY